MLKAMVMTSVSNSGQNFKTRVSGSWEKKPGFFQVWNERDFERWKVNIIVKLLMLVPAQISDLLIKLSTVF